MAWILLFVAGLLEITWSFFMKKSDGFTVLLPSLLIIATMFGSIVLLAIALKTLPLGTAYTVWTGIGAVGAFIVGIAVLGEAPTPARFLAATLIVAGIVLMNLSSN